MILDEIIELKKEKGIDFGETYPQLLRHYKGALRQSKLEYVVDGGTVVGFIDWLRLPEAPQNRDFGWAEYPVQKGDYIYILTVVSRDKKIFWELIKRVRKKNKNALYCCYHNDNKLKIWRLQNGKGIKGNLGANTNSFYRP